MLDRSGLTFLENALVLSLRMKGWIVHMEVVRNDHVEVGRNFIIYDMRRSGSSGSGTPAWRLFTDAISAVDPNRGCSIRSLAFSDWLIVLLNLELEFSPDSLLSGVCSRHHTGRSQRSVSSRTINNLRNVWGMRPPKLILIPPLVQAHSEIRATRECVVFRGASVRKRSVVTRESQYIKPSHCFIPAKTEDRNSTIS
jgi:hypothetical protein